MEKKYGDIDLKEAQRLAGTDVGKQLMALLKSNHSSQMQQVMDSFQRGDVNGAKDALSALMADEHTRKLLEQLQEAQHGRNGR